MPVQIVTWVGVLVGLLFLGSLGSMVTPKRDTPPREALSSLPLAEAVVEHAQSGYQLDTCVRDISSRTVLSNQVSGKVNLVVLEGAPVTECFPGLTEFLENGQKSEGNGNDRLHQGGVSYGADVRTSVTVLPPTAPSAPLSSQQNSGARPIVATGTVPVSLPATASSSSVSGGGGASVGGPAVPPISADQFDACRIRLFGNTVPSELSDTEMQAFESCLIETAE
jgi:hypothetical protein